MGSAIERIWKLHGDGRSVSAGRGGAPGRAAAHLPHARPRRAARAGDVRRHRARAGADRLPGHDDRLLLGHRDDPVQPDHAQPRAVLHGLELRVHRAGDRRRRRTAACPRRSAASSAPASCCSSIGLIVDRVGYGVDRVPAAAGGHGRDRRPDRPQPRPGGEGPVHPAGRDRDRHAGVDPADRRRAEGLRVAAVGVRRGGGRLRLRRDPRQGRLGRRPQGRLDRLPGHHDAALQRQGDRADRARRDPRAAGRERRPRQGGGDDDRARPRPADRPLVHGRRRRDDVSRPVRRLGHHHLRGEHRRHGLHARLLDARLPDRRHDRDPARPAAEVRRDHQRDPGRRARRRR